MAKTKDFAKFLAEQIASDETLADEIDRERLNGEIANIIYVVRTEENITQKELADMVGTHQSVIARLEDAEYNGRTIELLRKVLRALGRRLTLSAPPVADDSATVDLLPPSALKLWNPPPGSPPITKRTVSAAQ